MAAAAVVVLAAVVALIVRELRPDAAHWADGADRNAPVGMRPTPPPPAVAPRPVEQPPAVDPLAASIEEPPGDPAPARPRAQGTVVLNATPWGAVYVDGALVGNTPQLDLRLSVGTHTIRIVRDGYTPWEEQVQVRRGETLRLTDIVLEPISP
jgi:serine/threonine-protein kinase